MHPLIVRLVQDRCLSRDESHSVFSAVVRGELSDVELAALLIGLKCLGESPDVLAGAAQAMLQVAQAFPRPARPFADVVGTGGDGAHTINISTAVAFVTAAAGLPVAKHGNRAVSSKCGSADLLECFGMHLELSPQHARRCLDETGFGFLFAPAYHPGIRHAMPVRKQLATRTIFNILGPLLNPARPPIMLLGVYHPSLCHPVAETLSLLGCQRALVVHGSGLDEVAIHGPTIGIQLIDSEISEIEFAPHDFGAKTHSLASIQGGTTEENAKHVSAVLQGTGKEPHAAAVAVNSAAILFLSGVASSLADGYQRARDLMLSGVPWTLVERCIALSRSDADVGAR